MQYIYSIVFDTDENVLLLKDSTNHFGTRQFYGLKALTLEKIKEITYPSIDLIMNYYKELCSSQDEAN